MKRNIYDTIKKNKFKIIIIIGMFLIVCGIFFFLYRYLYPQNNICILKQEYANYTNNINVTIIRDDAIFKETFKSSSPEIIKYKDKELKKRGYSTIIKKSTITSTKKVKEKDILKKLINSGYTCNNEKKEIHINFKVKEENTKETSTSLEVANEYKSELLKAKINKKDYSKKVILKENINKEKLGKYIASYNLRVSKYREEFIYKIIEVKDTTSPIIKLNGDSQIELIKGDIYKEQGVEVSDNYDERELLKVNVTGNVDTSKEGEYIITYEAIDTSGNKSSLQRKVIVKDYNITYINGILVVNKKYALPKDYNPGLLKETKQAYDKLAEAAAREGYNIPIVSGFRSYTTQETIYNNYISIYGQEETDTFSAKPGHSEHQSGLAMDVGKIDDDYGSTKEGMWLAENAHKYGFIIRYPKGKEHITGYKYEPWHIRYLGVETATNIYKSGLTLEEYLKIA